MLRQSTNIQEASFNKKQQLNKDTEKTSVNDRSLLLDIVNELHSCYSMEKRDRPNNVIRVLVELHRLGASQEQLSIAYHNTLLDVESTRFTKVDKSTCSITVNNWQENLGRLSLYSDYLLFFDNQLSNLNSLDKLLNQYFYSIPYSIGSQLQPLVHLSFAIQHDLPQIACQALAYYCSSYVDASSIIRYCQENVTTTTTTTAASSDESFVNNLLFNLVRSDQRFDGKMEGSNTFHSAVKLLLKSKSDLLKTYMSAWSLSSSLPVEQRLNTLLSTSICMFHNSIITNNGKSSLMQLDWFLAGGQLVDSCLAIRHLFSHNSELLNIWTHLQFLSTLCTFVVQGRPVITDNNYSTRLDWETCISAVIESGDPKVILALSSILNASKLPLLLQQQEQSCLEIANVLAFFVLEGGVWVKPGLGWL